jgi:hypothetical protein
VRDISLPHELLEKLGTIEWFSRVDRDDAGVERSFGIPARRAPSAAEARESLASPEWEGVTADAAGRLTSWLHDRCMEEFRRWNQLVEEAKGVMEVGVLPGARAFAVTSNIGDLLVDCVAWDVLHGIMELTYAQCGPPTFFDHLLHVYEAGHLPCGWEGEWPMGTLIFW